MLISDELLELMADEFVALGLHQHGVTLEQFLNAPGLCRDLYSKGPKKTCAQTGRTDEPMRHHRFVRSVKKANFRRKGAQA